MKNILVIGSGAMGAAFTIPCLDNNHKVTLCEPYNYGLVKKILSKKKFHPNLKLNLPKKLIVKKFSQEILTKKWDLIAIAVSSIGIDLIREKLKQLKNNCPILVLTKGLKYEKNSKRIITMSEQLNRDSRKLNLSVLKGPCLARELAKKINTSAVIANIKISEAKINFSNVEFAYEAKEGNVLNGINLEFKGGKMTSLVILAEENVDIDGIGMYTLGKHRKKLKDTQLKEYETLFKKYFLKSFSSRLSEYTDPKINVISQKVINEKYTIVQSVLEADEKRPEIRIDWRVYTINPDKPLVRDLIIEGLSLARTQREEFHSVIQNGDGNIEVLFNNLKEFIRS